MRRCQQHWILQRAQMKTKEDPQRDSVTGMEVDENVLTKLGQWLHISVSSQRSLTYTLEVGEFYLFYDM